MREALAGLQSETEGRSVEVIIREAPPCRGDPALLRQAFSNLLGNALKFTRPRETARIEVGCDETGDHPVYFVRDNGVGFDPRHGDKLFGLFQRLHSPDAFEGTGVGLAIVQRILHRHGGRIWARGAVGEGATFYFTIGESDPEAPG
jgi:light-regulated signal transduction histidine kinase (bacteriophytochrome)